MSNVRRHKGAFVFLLVSNLPQARAVLEKPRMVLAVGAAVLFASLVSGGASPYLVGAVALPLLEFWLLGKSALAKRRFAVAWVAVAVLAAHAALLAIMQSAAGTVVHKLAINFAYTAAVICGGAVGALLFGVQRVSVAGQTGARERDA
jgi:hypothetical protein